MSDNLSELISQAENTSQQQAEARPAAKRKPIPFRLIFGVLLASVVAYAGTKISAALSPPTQKEVAHDLEVVIDKAHDAIEAAKTKTGELPDALPNAALASVVRYDHDKDTYSLSATILGIRVTLEPGGKKKTETGVQ